MAIAQMEKVIIVTHRSQASELLEALQHEGICHILNAEEAMVSKDAPELITEAERPRDQGEEQTFDIMTSSSTQTDSLYDMSHPESFEVGDNTYELPPYMARGLEINRGKGEKIVTEPSAHNLLHNHGHLLVEIQEPMLPPVQNGIRIIHAGQYLFHPLYEIPQPSLQAPLIG